MIKSVSELLVDANNQGHTYIMHSCDYTGGAYFRTTMSEEKHVFYDPLTGAVRTINEGISTTKRLISVVNSKRGSYFTVFYEIANKYSILGYSSSSNIWDQKVAGS